MKKRIIGATVFFILLILSFILNLFNYLILIYGIIGIYEILQALKCTKERKKQNYLIFYTIIFLLGISALIILNIISTQYVLVLLLGVMLNDIFAYFIGKSIGKIQFSKVSPNKTIEGVIGGIVVSNMFYVLYVFLFKNNILKITPNINNIEIVTIIVLVLFTSILGDLLESKMKRNAKIKDSGYIVYGHGGILDRIDSWITSSILFLLLIIVLN